MAIIVNVEKKVVKVSSAGAVEPFDIDVAMALDEVGAQLQLDGKWR